MVTEQEETPPESPARRLIIVLVEPGEDPVVEYDGPFAAYEVVAALRRAIEMVIEDEIVETIIAEQEETDDDGTP